VLVTILEMKNVTTEPINSTIS